MEHSGTGQHPKRDETLKARRRKDETERILRLERIGIERIRSRSTIPGTTVFRSFRAFDRHQNVRSLSMGGHAGRMVAVTLIASL